MTSPSRFQERFSAYFQTPVALASGGPLSAGAEIRFEIVEDQPPFQAVTETFTFTRLKGRSDRAQEVSSGPGKAPQVTFRLPPKAAELILGSTHREIAEIGIEIAKLLFSPDPELRIRIQLHASFLTLFSQGYFGVVALGGTGFARFLATKGLDGMNAIRAALKRIRSDSNSTGETS